jgi:DNA-directed RNA polymerase subunit RPC12/RpoP
MPSGLFEVVCPRCGTELELTGLGTGQCPRCGQPYLLRVGHLIPVQRHAAPAGGVRPQGAP